MVIFFRVLGSSIISASQFIHVYNFQSSWSFSYIYSKFSHAAQPRQPPRNLQTVMGKCLSLIAKSRLKQLQTIKNHWRAGRKITARSASVCLLVCLLLFVAELMHVSMNGYWYVCLSGLLYLSVCLCFICLSAFRSIYLSCLPIRLCFQFVFVNQSVLYPSAYLCVCLSFCLSLYLYFSLSKTV